MIFSIGLVVLIIVTSLLICGRVWKSLSNFFHKSYSYFDFVFVVLYFSEQFAFLLAYNLVGNYRELWVGLIVLFVLTTASLDKFVMESKNRRNARIVSTALREREILVDIQRKQEKEIETLRNENQEIINFVEKKFRLKHSG